VLRYFHRQFHKFFKQFRTKELYEISLRYLSGELEKQFPNRKINSQTTDGANPLVVSESPYIMARLAMINRKYVKILEKNLLKIENILDRIELGQLHEYLSDCENYNRILKELKIPKQNCQLDAIHRILSRKSYFLESIT